MQVTAVPASSFGILMAKGLDSSLLFLLQRWVTFFLILSKDEAMEGALEELLAAYITELNESTEGSVYPRDGMVPTDQNNE